MAKEERILYSDANGVRIGTVNAVFGQHKYATRNIEAALLASEAVIRWPGYAVMAVGIAAGFYGLLGDNTTWLLIGVAGLASGTLNLARKKQNFAVRLFTTKGAVLVLASRDKAYIQTVVDTVHRATEAARAPGADRENALPAQGEEER